MSRTTWPKTATFAILLVACGAVEPRAERTDGAATYEDGVAAVDAHIATLEALEAAGASHEETVAQITLLADEEVALVERLSETDAVGVASYAQQALDARPGLRAWLSDTLTTPTTLGATDARTGLVGAACYIVGLIVCHQRCCNPDRGNGVAVCVGGVTCSNCWSDSC